MNEGIDLAALRAGLAALFPASDPTAAEVLPLAGDASTRRYYRVRNAPGAPLPSVVVMRYPDEVPPEAELPFLNVHRYLTAAGIPVPAVYRSDPKANLLFLEDAGDTMLEDAVRDLGVGGCLPLYEQCVEILVRIQSEGTHAL
ncbi:MAG TPA: phosphotransferase, partial [Thermodesulfobacteriota bacterium]|nr:phosphotransferase [Thermodesulfobacteriota bacterium]